MAENVNPLIGLVAQNPVWTSFHIDGLDSGESLGIPHDDGFTRSEAMMGLGVDRRSVAAGGRNLSNLLERIQIVDRDPAGRAGTGNVEPASSGVRVDVIKPTSAADLGGLRNFVGSGLLGESEQRG